MADNEVRPQAANQGAQKTAGEHVTASIAAMPVDQSRGAYSVLDAALGAAIVVVIRELRPNLPIPVARSLAVEVIDQARVDADWIQRRQTVEPHVTAASYNRHVGHPYSERRAAEMCNALHISGDYPGRSGVT